MRLLPSSDYASIDETKLDENHYNWGYDPANYNVPDGSYSTEPYQPAVRVKEFKQMVQALHRAGIRVIMDVVYNHTFNTLESNFERTVPGYFYRQKEDGTLANGSGCGNETASERSMMRKFMIESVLYWIKEYHIDGFRFDLMGVHDIETMNEIRKAVNKVDPVIGLKPLFSPRATIVKNVATRMVTLVHRPSRPSVKFTQLSVPSRTTNTNGMYRYPRSSIRP